MGVYRIIEENKVITVAQQVINNRAMREHGKEVEKVNGENKIKAKTDKKIKQEIER